MKDILKPGIHWMIIFIPIAIFLESTHANAPLIFFSAALGIIPIARLIGQSTEHLATYTGDAVGGLLNATFGNAPELIIAIVALNAGLHQLVLASLVGAILGNLLLAMGISFLVGGIRFHNQDSNPTSIRIYSSMMMLAVISLMAPSAFHVLFGDGVHIAHENNLNISLSVLLLTGYILYLIFMLKTHPDFFKSKTKHDDTMEHDRWSMQRSIITLAGASIAAAFMSELLVGAAEETGKELGMSNVFIGVIVLAIVGGAAESISAVTMASRNKMDLSVSIAMGSSIQIAIFIAPLLVLLSLVIGPGQMNLAFGKGMTGILFLSVIIAAMVAGDGRYNWYKGVQLVIVYMIIALLLFFLPL